jgi:DUF1680 family protein
LSENFPVLLSFHGMRLIVSVLGLCAAAPLLAAPPQATLMPLSAVRITDGPFADALESNRRYLLALHPDRLLAPFLREAGLPPKAEPYGNWESGGLDGHTAGHYLSALATMIASGADTKDGELARRLDQMLDELERCQQASGNGYLGGVPGSKALWEQVSRGEIEAHGFGVNGKWVPWYNLHKTFAGLRDAWTVAGRPKAKDLLVRYGDWCVGVVSKLNDEQMQRMMRSEFGGMNEVMADIHAITGDPKYLAAAKQFQHRAVLEPLTRGEDRLTGLHANTQIPKVIGMQRIAMLGGGEDLQRGTRFFWETVTKHRSVAFGGNSVAEHFNDPADFRRMLEHREGPETCNTYNLLRLTGMLFETKPNAGYADYYERALYNHILSSIHPKQPGYVYFTPIRPQHYRVYSEPEHCFWCCVGSGMENPGRYGEFIYAKCADGWMVNLFIPSTLQAAEGVHLVQETHFPFESNTRIRLELAQPREFTLHLRKPGWLPDGTWIVKVNESPVETESGADGYLALRRTWRDGDRVTLEMPMRTRVERLPDGTDWVAILHGPIVLASPAGKDQLVGLRADGSRMGHVAHGPQVPLDQVPVLLGSVDSLPAAVKPDPAAGPLHFRFAESATEPATQSGLPLVPFFSLHDERYQMYWEISTPEKLTAGREKRAAAAREQAEREAATLDMVTAGEQQPEVEHALRGEGMETGLHERRHWRHGKWFEYTLDPKGQKNVDLEVTYWGGDAGRTFDILANGNLIASESLDAQKPGEFISKRYPIPQSVFTDATSRLTIRFNATKWVAGGVYEVRLMRK